MGSHLRNPVAPTETALPCIRLPHRRRRGAKPGEAKPFEVTAGRRSFDAEAFKRDLHFVLRRIRRLGLRRFDAYALALEILWPAATKRDHQPPRPSARRVKTEIRDWRRGEDRRRNREARASSPEVPTGVWRAPPSGTEAEEVCGFLTEALHAMARNVPREDLSLFAQGALARWKGSATSDGSGTTRLERRIRGILIDELLRRGVELADLGASRGVGLILLRKLRLWARGEAGSR